MTALLFVFKESQESSLPTCFGDAISRQKLFQKKGNPMSENIIATKKKRTKSQIEYDAQTNTAYYNNEFYRIPPTEEIQLAEFENYAIERLTILKHMENMRIRGIFGQEYESEVKKLIKSTRLDLDPKRDIIGHFTLRLAFSRM